MTGPWSETNCMEDVGWNLRCNQPAVNPGAGMTRRCATHAAKANRWAAFSDDELRTIHEWEGLVGSDHRSTHHPVDFALGAEIAAEIEARAAQRTEPA